MPTPKKRLDQLSVEMGLFANRQSAITAIMSGAVLVNGQKCLKPGTLVAANSSVETIPSWKISPYVSRGGFKLEHALKEFQVKVRDRICLDIGASTGGFTDCLLQNGAARVYAIDVGYGQIDWKLRQDNRVTVLERINARNLSKHMLYQPEDSMSDNVTSGNAMSDTTLDNTMSDLAVIDVSFISVTKIFRSCLSCMKESSAEIVCLIKPQFEAGPELVKHGGVVRCASTHLAVLRSIVNDVPKIGLIPTAVTFSPLKGPAGNIEFFLHIQTVGKCVSDSELEATVSSAHLLHKKAPE